MVPVAFGLPMDRATPRRFVEERQELRARRDLALLWRRLVRSQGAYHRAVHRVVTRHLRLDIPRCSGAPIWDDAA